MNPQQPTKPKKPGNNFKILNPLDLADLALDIWRLKNRISKLKDKIDDESLKPITYFLESCSRNLTNMGIETKDNYTGEIYKSSMNVDVVTYESVNMEGDEAKVKETLEPAILFGNDLLHKAKVVVATPRV